MTGARAGARRHTLLLMLCVAVLSAGLPSVLNSHWMLIDDQMVVGQQLWPPNSSVNQSWHEQGREFIAHGVYFKLLSLIFPLQPVWYYLVNFLTHLTIVVLVFVIVLRTAKSNVAATIVSLAVAFASTGPEVFLTLVKQELIMTLAIVCALLVLERILAESQTNESPVDAGKMGI